MQPLVVRSAHLVELEAHLSNALPEEGCGLIAGVDGVSVHVFPVENILHSRSRFEMERQALYTALDTIMLRGWALLASFHSHPGPIGQASLSQEDRQLAAYPDAAVLLCYQRLGSWQRRAFRWQPDTDPPIAVEVPLRIATA